MRGVFYSGLVGVVVGGLGGLLLVPPKVETRTQILEVTKTVEVIKEVEVVRVVKADTVIARKITETRPDATVIVTEEQLIDRTVTTQTDRDTVQVVDTIEVKQNESARATPIHRPFEVLVTSSPIPSLDKTQLFFGYQPLHIIPVKVFLGSNINRIDFRVGLSISF